MNKIIQWVIGVVAVIALILGLVGNNQSADKTLGAGTRFPNGISADTTSPTSGQIRGTTLTVTGNSTLTGSVTSSGRSVIGGNLSTTTTISMTLAPSDLAYSTISMLLGGTSGTRVTLNLPATTTSGMSTFLPNAGDRTSILLINATTSATNIYMASSTGSILLSASSTPNIPGATVGRLDIVRKANTDIVFGLTPYAQ